MAGSRFVGWLSKLGSAGRLSSPVVSPDGRQQSLDMLADRAVEATQGLACCSLEVASWRKE